MRVYNDLRVFFNNDHDNKGQERVSKLCAARADKKSLINPYFWSMHREE